MARILLTNESLNNNLTGEFVQNDLTTVNPIKKVTFFDEVQIDFTNDDYYKDLSETQMISGGIYFSPASNNELSDTPHHIAHNNRIYTLGPDISVTDNGIINAANTNGVENNVVLNSNNNLTVITNITSDRFKKILNITTQKIDFSKIVNLINQLNTRISTLEEKLQSEYNKTVVTVLTPPSPIYNLKYSAGNTQQLILPGVLNIQEGATILYSTTVDGEFSELIPTATNAGTYNIYYKVNITDKSKYIGPTTVFGAIQTTINKATLVVTWPTPINSTVTGNNMALFNNGSIKLNNNNISSSIAEFKYAVKNSNVYSSVVPTASAIGEYNYDCIVDLKDTDNYILSPESAANSITLTAKINEPENYKIYIGPKCDTEGGQEVVDGSSSKLITNKSDITDDTFSSYKNYAIRVGDITSISMYIPFKVYITTHDDKCKLDGLSQQTSIQGIYGYSLSGSSLGGDIEILIVKQ